MAQSSPIRAGFDALWREPVTVLAEIAWRWTFGAAAVALSTASLMVYLNTLTVSRPELVALRSKTPWLMIDAVVHILSGSGPRLVLIALLVSLALTVAWIAIASLGRAATLERLCARVSDPTLAQNARVGQPSFPAGQPSIRVGQPSFRVAQPSFWNIILLHIVRSLFFWASSIAFVGAAILADRAARAGSKPSFGIYALVFLLLTMVITFAHSRVTWLASVAGIFVWCYRDTVARSLQRSAALFTSRARQITKINMILSGVHFAVFVAASFMSVAALALFGHVPAGIALGATLVIALGYFAFADFLYIARLAAYVSLIEPDVSPLVPQAPAHPPPNSTGTINEGPATVPPPLESPAW